MPAQEPHTQTNEGILSPPPTQSSQHSSTNVRARVTVVCQEVSIVSLYGLSPSTERPLCFSFCNSKLPLPHYPRSPLGHSANA